MAKVFSGLMLVVIVVAAALFWWIQDANRLKPQLESLLSESLEMPVTIDGDVAWKLWPPIYATAQNLTADDGESKYAVSSLQLRVTFVDLFSGVSDWQVSSLKLQNVDITSTTGATHLDRLNITDYQPGAWASLIAEGASDGTSFNVIGDFLHADEESFKVTGRNLRVSTGDVTAECEGVLTEASTEVAARDPQTDTLLPLDLIEAYRWTAECNIPQFTANDTTFTDISVQLLNDDEHMRTALSVPNFFNGAATFLLTNQVTNETASWSLQPAVSGAHTQPLMTWLGKPLDWQGELELDGTLKARGNTLPEIMRSLSGIINYDGGEGDIDISEIKQQVASLARYTKEASSVNNWPDTWHYKHFVGAWRIDGRNQRMDFALDNLTVLAEGQVDLLQDQLDMDASMTFGDDDEYTKFDVNPLLVGLPIPAQCRGSLAEAQCKLDQSQALKNVGRALSSGEGTALRSKLEEKIDEEVPEQYRDAARSLLDLLTGSRTQPDEE